MSDASEVSVTLFIEETLRSEVKNKFSAWAQHSSSIANSIEVQEIRMLGEDNFEKLSTFILSSTSKFVAFVFEPITLRIIAKNKFFKEVTDLVDSDVMYFDSREIQRVAFSPERLRGQNYLGPFVLFKRETLLRSARLDLKFGSSSVLKQVLSFARENKKISHARTQVFHEATIKPRHVDSKESLFIKETIEGHLQLTGGGHCHEVLSAELFPSERQATDNPLISIIIPTRGKRSPEQSTDMPLVIRTVKSVEETSQHLNIEYVIVVDQGYDEEVISELTSIAGPRLKLVLWEEPFNFSKKMNFGFVHSSGEFVLLLNDDVEVISDRWIDSLLALAQLPNAGMAGAMLYYEDGTIQHAGHAYYHGSPTHLALNAARGSQGPRGALLIEREVSGVTAACAMMPREVFIKVGGFSALLPGNFNDVDLCLKVGWQGYDIYWTPFAELYHFESKTRDAHVHYYELDVIAERWGPRLEDNRFWHGHPQNAKFS